MTDSIKTLAEEAAANEYEIDYPDEKYYVKGFEAGFLAAQKKVDEAIDEMISLEKNAMESGSEEYFNRCQHAINALKALKIRTF